MSGFKKRVNRSSSKARQSARASVVRSNRIKAIFIVAAFILVGVGVFSIQKVQIYKSEAKAGCHCVKYPDGTRRCDRTCASDQGQAPRPGDAAIYGAPRGGGTKPSSVANQARNLAADAVQYAQYIIYLRSIGQPDTSANRARYLSSNNSAAAARAAEEARVRAEWQRAYAYALEVKKQQEYRDAAAYARACQAAQSIKPTLTWLSSQGGRSFILPGEKKIKFQVGAGQDGAIIFIDDKATPWSGSCNDLKTGDQCLVPDGKGVNKHADGTRITKEQVGAAGKTQTTYSGFEAGHQYTVWLKGMSCGKPSPDSNKLNITVAGSVPAGGVSTTPTVTPGSSNTQQTGQL